MDNDIYQQVDTEGRPVHPMDDQTRMQLAEEREQRHWHVFLAALTSASIDTIAMRHPARVMFALALADEAVRQYRVPEGQ